MTGETDPLILSLKDAGFGVTYFDAHGANGPVRVVYTVIDRKELSAVVRLLQTSHLHVFYTVEEARLANEGVFHRSQPQHPFRYLGLRGKG